MSERAIGAAEWRFTAYFELTRQRADRSGIALAWIIRAASEPEHQRAQVDGRYRRWRRIPEAGGRWLRVIVLPDQQTIHNAFFDRGFVP